MGDRRRQDLPNPLSPQLPCGVVVVGHGRRVHRAHDAPTFGTAVVVCWRKQVWRCPDPRWPWTRAAAMRTRSAIDLPDAVAVLDAFHVAKLGTNVVDEVRRVV